MCIISTKKKPQTQTYSNQNWSRNLKALKCKEMETESCAGADAGAETLCPEGSCCRRCACRGRLLCQGRAVLLRTPHTQHRPYGPSFWWGYGLISSQPHQRGIACERCCAGGGRGKGGHLLLLICKVNPKNPPTPLTQPQPASISLPLRN